MTSTNSKASIADKGQAVALRLLAKAGGHDLLKNPAVRSKVERALYNGSKQGFKVQTAAGRAFAKKSGSGEPARPAPTKPRREFDLTPTEDQAMIAGVAAELADEVLRPAAADADGARAVPDEIRAQAAEMGLTLLSVPAELGGVAEERSAVMNVLVLEQLARGDMGLAVGIMAPAAVAGAGPHGLPEGCLVRGGVVEHLDDLDVPVVGEREDHVARAEARMHAAVDGCHTDRLTEALGGGLQPCRLGGERYMVDAHRGIVTRSPPAHRIASAPSGRSALIRDDADAPLRRGRSPRTSRR